MKYHEFTAAANTQGSVDAVTALTLNQLTTETLSSTFDACTINAEGGDLRYLMGNTPTATLGMQLLDGQTLLIRGDVVSKLKIISKVGTIKVNIQIGNMNV